jgi:hypothetical protein
MFVALAACGDSDPDTDAATAVPRDVAQLGSARPIPTDIEVCELLTDEQIATVLPGHEGGFEAASGESLFGDNTQSYKCSYDAEQGNAVFFFTIDLTVGEFGVRSYQAGRELAEAEGDIDRRIDVADGGWIEVGDDWLGQGIPHVTATVLKNPTEISILLMTPDAHDKIDQVIELASLVASNLD